VTWGRARSRRRRFRSEASPDRAETELSIGTDPIDSHSSRTASTSQAAIRGPAVTAGGVGRRGRAGRRGSSSRSSRPSSRRIRASWWKAETSRPWVRPDATLKVYHHRVRRGPRRSGAVPRDAADVAATAADMARRDRYDSSRAADPLQQVSDAIEVDTTGLSIDEVVSRLLDLLS
jgi:cytidylate kinase